MPNNFPCGTQYDREKMLDHGTMVPLYFINQKYTDYQLVRIGLSGYPLSMHYELGMYINEAVKQLNRRTVWIASGDLSHCNKGSHYGYHPEGPEYDQKIMATIRSGNLGEMLDYDSAFLDKAMECGHRSFTMMAGAFDGMKVKTEVLSYQAPYGIGYGVAVITPDGKDESRKYFQSFEEKQMDNHNERYEKADAYVKLAYDQVFRWVREHRMIPLGRVPEEMKEKAGVFVSIHENGQLRGCIGTIRPCYANTADEIIHNAVAACSQDPRFSPVREEELDQLVITVDVLSPSERIQDKSQLDVHKYGVICSTKDGRRGLLLPDLEGVDTVERQIEIACSKGNIDPTSDDVILDRFEVVRHY
jgi:AmmeMemoRadiSam system protein A